MKFFSLEDFETYYKRIEGQVHRNHAVPDWVKELIADKANHLLEERGVRVYQMDKTKGPPLWYQAENSSKNSSHTALLVAIEELPKKECEHAPIEEIVGHIYGPVYIPECKHCGVDLTATWSAE
jgi:hypothetical protein